MFGRLTNVISRLRGDNADILPLHRKIDELRLQISEREEEVSQHKSMVSQLEEGSVIRQRLRLLPKAESFLHYNSALDCHRVIAAHEYKERASVEGQITNFLGVHVNVRFFSGMQDMGGTVEGIPHICNFHAEVTEWAAALRAVDLSKNTFTVCELGAGFGCWMVNTAVAAKKRGLIVKAIGVEADEEHARWMAEHCAQNGISSDEFIAIRAIAGPHDGVALFPVVDDSSATYGLEPRFFHREETARAALESGRFTKLPMVSADTIFGHSERIDLLHIDIQGGEADFIRSALSILQQRVAYIVIGTHSRSIEGQIIADLTAATGWDLEIEKPCDFYLPGLHTHQDGLQAWRNIRLT